MSSERLDWKKTCDTGAQDSASWASQASQWREACRVVLSSSRDDRRRWGEEIVTLRLQLVAAMRDIEFLNALLTGKGSHDDKLVVAMREHRSAYKTGC